MLGSIISAAIQGVLGWFSSLIGALLQRRADVAQGASAQAAKETASAEDAEARIAKAEAQAPKTDAELEERMSKGTF